MSIRKGDILLTGGRQDISSKEDKANKVTSVSESSTDLEYPSAGALYRALLEKQNNLISGTNIKTINGESLLGSGNIEISGGGSFDPYAYNIQTKQTLDLTNFSSDYFYPVSWGPTLAFVSLDIRSPGLGASNPYNQNRLSASISSMGYSDTPKTINVYESAQYDENEITIYGIYTGNTYGANCVYLRGGLVYEANCNVTLTPHQYEYRYEPGDSPEVFPIMDSSYNFVTTASNIAKVWDAVGWKGYGYTSRGFQSGTAIVGRTLKVNADTDLTISGSSSGKVNFETIFGSGYVFDKPIKSNGDIISGGKICAGTFERNTIDTWIPVIRNGYLDFTIRKFATNVVHTNHPTDQDSLATLSFLSFWNGAYASDGNSNLSRCASGEIASKEYVNSQPVLWKGVYYMSAGQTVNLSQTISSQKTGIVLIFGAYSNGTAQHYNHTCYFIPKTFINYWEGDGVMIPMGGSEGVSGSKYVYVSDNKITGNEQNETANNKKWVLTDVIGV